MSLIIGFFYSRCLFAGMDAKSMYYSKWGKRIFDLVLTIPGLLVIAPALLMIALLVRLQLGSPVLFRQVRPGLYGNDLAALRL